MTLKEYLQVHKNYFWRFEDDGAVVVTPDGSTIAYTDLLINMLEVQQPNGLPPFGAILLFVVATNEGLHSPIDYIDNLLSEYLISNNKYLRRRLPF
jgi:hypothetical protein